MKLFELCMKKQLNLNKGNFKLIYYFHIKIQKSKPRDLLITGVEMKKLIKRNDRLETRNILEESMEKFNMLDKGV